MLECDFIASLLGVRRQQPPTPYTTLRQNGESEELSESDRGADAVLGLCGEQDRRRSSGDN